MKKLRKYISAAAAVAIFASFGTFASFAQAETSSGWGNNSAETEETVSEPTPDIDDEEEVEVLDGDDPESIDESEDIDDSEGIDIPEDPEETSDGEEIQLVTDPPQTQAPTTAAPANTTAQTAAPATTTTAGTVAPYTEVAQYKMYATAGVNVRTGPGTNYGIIGSVSEGKEVTVIGTSGSWLVIS